MSKIQWGEPIQVDGVRPDWLRSTDTTDVRTAAGWCYPSGTGSSDPDGWAWKHGSGAINITHIRLPADHPYYLATSKGFTYWPGGDEAPADWDGGDVLWRDGSAQRSAYDWRVGQNIGAPQFSDIIGYKRTAAPDVSPELVNRMVQLVRDLAATPIGGRMPDGSHARARAIVAELPSASHEPSDIATQLNELRECHEVLASRVNTLERSVYSTEHRTGRRI